LADVLFWALIERPLQQPLWRLDARLNRMTLLHRSNLISALLLATSSVLLIGCASPGPPQPPSLRLPQPARDLTAQRLGGAVELSFTVPWQSTDKLPLHNTSLRGVVCREADRQGCVAVAGLTPSLQGPPGEHNRVTWQDVLPSPLSRGAPRLLSYRVEFFNDTGRSAGRSEPAYAVAGSAPANVTGLHAEGSRLGVVLSWTPAPAADGEVLLERQDLRPRSTAPDKLAATTARKPGRSVDANILWLQANGSAGRTLDTTAEPGITYRYTAVRQRMAQLDGHTLTYRSGDSAPVAITLQQIYPPQAPSGLTATGFASAVSGSFAVDLIWQPIDDDGLLAGLAGYNVYREPLDAEGHSTGNNDRLNSTPVLLPSFHDATTQSGRRYRYGVTAVDKRGNESAAAVFVLEPLQQ
jgi:hypothetical protein